MPSSSDMVKLFPPRKKLMFHYFFPVLIPITGAKKNHPFRSWSLSTKLHTESGLIWKGTVDSGVALELYIMSWEGISYTLIKLLRLIKISISKLLLALSLSICLISCEKWQKAKWKQRLCSFVAFFLRVYCKSTKFHLRFNFAILAYPQN